MIEPAKIGFDFDGVVADTMAAFIRLAVNDYNIKISPLEVTNFLVEECLDIVQGIIDSIITRLVDGTVGSGLVGTHAG